ncbi:PAS domain S-box protein [bacterium]|nr:PAS domain S-box protein [bacterium]
MIDFNQRLLFLYQNLSKITSETNVQKKMELVCKSISEAKLYADSLVSVRFEDNFWIESNSFSEKERDKFFQQSLDFINMPENHKQFKVSESFLIPQGGNDYIFLYLFEVSKGFLACKTPFFKGIPSLETIKIFENFFEIVFNEFRKKIETQRTQKEIEELQIKYNFLVYSSKEGFYLIEDGKFEFVNQKFADIYGIEPKDFIGKPIDDFVLPKDRKMVLERYNQRLKGEKVPENYSFHILDFNGSEKSVRVSVKLINLFGKQVLLGVTEDITEHENLKAALSETQVRLQEIANSISDYLWSADIVEAGEIFDYTFISPAIEKITGYKVENFLGRNSFWLSLVPEEDHHILTETFDDLMDGKPVKRAYRIRRKDGEMRWVSSTVTPIKDGNGNVFRVMGIISDVTERILDKQKLEESEKKFHSLFQSSSNAIFLLSEDGEKILDCNNKALEIFGFTRESFLQRRNCYFSPEFQPDGKSSKEKGQKIIQAVLKGDECSFEWRHLRNDGSSFDAEITLCKVEFNEKIYIQAIVRDITHQKELERQLIQAQKMEAVGTLAGGIAHDFNNILNGILGFASLLECQTELSKKNHDYVQKIIRSGKRAAELTAQMLAFARKVDVTSTFFDLHLSVKEILKIVKHSFNKNIEIEINFLSKKSSISGDEGKIEQVVLNLLNNAKDALLQGGKILISSKNIEINDLNKIFYPMLKIGNYIVLTIEDNGCGIPDKDLPKIFEPFFTTKEVGKGTGLGLAMVYGIVKTHNGHIEVSSKVGKGTKINLFLPIAEGVSPKTQNAESTKILKGKGKILIIDDEEVIREVLRDSLDFLGFSSILAQDGIEGVKIYEASQNEISLVICDFIMPKIDGKETIKRIKQINPDVKILISSGYTKEGFYESVSELKVLGFLQKPYELSNLSETINKVLE